MTNNDMTNELIEDVESAVNSWPNTTWHGYNVHKDIYAIITRDIEPIFESKGWTFQECYLGYLNSCVPKKSWRKEADFASESMYSDAHFNMTEDWNESNGFIVGYDIWIPDGDEATLFNSCYFKFNIVKDQDCNLRCVPDGRYDIHGTESFIPDGYSNKGFYSVGGARDKMLNEWSVTDLRLD